MRESDIEWEDERISKVAMLKLIELHREEYDELTGKAAADRAEELQRQVESTLRQIAALQKMNPNGVNAPALTQTANALVAENDELRAEVYSLERRIDRLAKENVKLRDLVAKPAEEKA
jgi:cell division protein FtsB